MTLCSNEQLSLIAKLLIQHGLTQDNPIRVFNDLAAQNIVGDGTENEKYRPFYDHRYVKDANPATYLPVQLIDAVISFQEACEANPMWKHSTEEQCPIKAMTHKLLRILSKTLEGYGNTWKPSPEVTLESIIANKSRLWNVEP